MASIKYVYRLPSTAKVISPYLLYPVTIIWDLDSTHLKKSCILYVPPTQWIWAPRRIDTLMRNLLFAVLLSVFPLTQISAGEPDVKLHQRCLYPTVMVTGNVHKTSTIGSGVIVKSVQEDKKWKHYFLSVAHILLPPVKNEHLEIRPTYMVKIGVYKNWSEYTGCQEYEATLVHAEKGLGKDMALFSFETDGATSVAEIYDSPKLYIGNEVIRVGCGLGEVFRLDYGKITSVKESKDRIVPATRNTHRISAATLPGDSGGPVFHEYKLIGITQTIRAMPTGSPIRPTSPVYFMTYVIPIERFLACEEIAKYLT